MFEKSVDEGALTGARKVAFSRENLPGYLIASMLAGIYVGLGILLIFSIGAPFAVEGHPAVRLVMGASFGLALTLVVFAGSELFTGNVMFMTFACLRKTATPRDLVRVWGLSWCGNLAGALLLALVATVALRDGAVVGLVDRVAGVKTAAAPWVLVASGALCNLFVCLALWTSSRTGSDTAKLWLIWWCLFGFIGAGLEHSVANMTLLALSVFGRGVAAVGWTGYVYNLLWVTLGNVVSGVLLAAAYHRMAVARAPAGAVPLEAKGIA